jgi:hypothetical protein
MEEESKPNPTQMPRPFANPDGIQKLREEARRRLDEEENKPRPAQPLHNPTPADNTQRPNMPAHGALPVDFHRLQGEQKELHRASDGDRSEAINTSGARADTFTELLKSLQKAPRSSGLGEELHQGSPADPNSENLGNEPGEAGQQRNSRVQRFSGVTVYGLPPLGIRTDTEEANRQSGGEAIEGLRWQPIGQVGNLFEKSIGTEPHSRDAKEVDPDLLRSVADPPPETPSSSGESRPFRRSWRVWGLVLVTLALLLVFTAWLFHKSR